MKVLLLSKACYVAVYRKKLEELAALPGVDLTLVVPPYWRTGKSKAMLEPGMFRGYTTVVEDPVLNGNFHLHFYRDLSRHLAALKPDLLHIEEEPYDFVTFHALRSARRAGVRAIFFTWQNIERRFPIPFRWFERHALGNCAGAIGGNQAAAEILRHKGYKGPLVVIPQFGVDPALFRPGAPGESTARNDRAGPSVVDDAGRERPAGARPFTIGFVGRLVPEKGLLILLDAVAGLEGQWRLVIVGDGPLRGRIDQTCAERGLGERVKVRSWVPSASVPQLLRGFDALAIPSLTTRGWKEQFGRVIVEAMATEVPVVGSDSGEIPHVIGDAGLVAREGDPAELRQHLRRLMADAAFRSDLAKRGRARVLAHFTQRQVAFATLEFYQQVLGLPGMEAI